MKVLYVSKALTVAAYRDKVRALAAHADVRAVMPERWGRDGVEPDGGRFPAVETRPALLHGHNHLHVYRRAADLFEPDAPDLVHIDEEPYSAACFQLARLCRRRGVPAVFFAWQNLDKRLPPPFGAMRRYVFRSVAGAIAGTERARAVLELAGWRGPAAVIPQFGVDPERFRPDADARRRTRERLGIGAAEFVIGFGGRLVREKGVHVLIEAMGALPDARLVLVGGGPERPRLERAASRAGIAHRVRFAGRVPSLEMPRWLAAFDALALPSLSAAGWVEQFGRILVEAMACGVPVVGSDAGEIPRVIGDAGRTVPEGDTGALADAMAGLAARPGDRRALGRRARDRVRRLFSQERVAAETVDFYRTLLGAAADGARSGSTASTEAVG